MNLTNILNFLEANQDKKVKTIQTELMALLSTVTTKRVSGPAKTHLRDKNNDVVAIYCYYHKRWELLSECEYGEKKHSTHGYNSMCKEGVNAWTKQNNAKKQISETVLKELTTGAITNDDIARRQAELEAEILAIIPRKDGKGYDDIADITSDMYAPAMTATKQQAEPASEEPCY